MACEMVSTSNSVAAKPALNEPVLKVPFEINKRVPFAASVCVQPEKLPVSKPGFVTRFCAWATGAVRIAAMATSVQTIGKCFKAFPLVAELEWGNGQRRAIVALHRSLLLLFVRTIHWQVNCSVGQAPPHIAAVLVDMEHDTEEQWEFESIKKRKKRGIVPESRDTTKHSVRAITVSKRSDTVGEFAGIG